MRPSADTNLFEFAPDHNLGLSTDLQIGRNNRGTRGRGLYRFDLKAIPEGAIIELVSLSMFVSGAGSEATTRHDLHAVQLAWAEGGSGGGQGRPVAEGESSWCARSHPDQLWTVPGGEVGSDFATAASAGEELAGQGWYVFESTPTLVADVQRWLDGTAENQGWALISGDEATNGNSRRIGTRESEEGAPVLTIAYTPFRITEVTRNEGGRVHLEWSGGRPPFAVESSEDGKAWQTVPGLTVAERSTNVAAQFGVGLLRVRDRADGAEASARYRVDWRATWSAATHPDGFPGGAHFSGLIGSVHNASVSFWEPGGLASPGIKRMAETGSKSPLSDEVTAAVNSGAAIAILSGSGIDSPGGTSLEFRARQSHPLVTLVCMVAPSPDWFVGVHGLELFADGKWLERVTVALDGYDAGTDSGPGYGSPNLSTEPAAPISRISGAPLLDGDKLRPLGVFTFTRIE